MSPTAIALRVERLTPAIGARISGIDIASDLHEITVAELRSLLLEHKLLVFPGQALTPDTQVAFASRFGELTPNHPITPPLDAEHPQVWQIETRNDQWHTDVTFVERPPAASVLRAINVPEFGGDTLWGDLEAAYESLTPGLQRLADELVAYHDGSDEFAEMLKAIGGVGNAWDGELFTEFEPVAHPVVRIHPETGRKSLFVNPGFTRRIAGVSEAESKYLLEIFYAHITKSEHVVRHRWTPGDVAFWDNRSTVHYATYDYPGFQRVMQRVTIAGDRPVGPAVRAGVAARGSMAHVGPDLLWGFLAGVVIAAVTTPVGVSGAVFLLPFQISVLGVPSPSVTPTNLLYNVLAVPGGLLRFARGGSLRSPLTRSILYGTVPASWPVRW